MKQLRLFLSIGDHMPLFPPYRWATEPMNLSMGRVRQCGIAWLCFTIEWYSPVREDR